ncbi:MAG: ABC transporter ATP-binding protein [Desulfosalsimonadaceae bacterium]|nr:ABC transporter ATP-binding protein [Desulfosalsimonadaceae bacterium]
MMHQGKETGILGLVDVFRELLRHLPINRRRQFWWILLAMVFSGGLETVAIGFIALFVSVIADPSAAVDLTYIKKFHHLTHADFLIHPEDLILFLSILVVCLVIIKNVIKAIVAYISTLYCSVAATHLGETLFSGFLYVPYEWHLSRNSADLSLAVLWRYFIARLMDAFLGVLSEILMVFVLVITAVIVEPFISMGVIGVVGASAIIIDRSIRKKIGRTARLSKDYQHMLNHEVTSAINAIKDVKIYTRQEELINGFSRDAYTGASLDAKQMFLGQCPPLALESMGFMLLGLTVIIMYYYVNTTPAQVIGLLSLLAVSAWRVLPGISKLLNRLSTARNLIPYATNTLDYINDIAKERPIDNHSCTNEKIIFKHAVTVENLTFSYRGASLEALKNVNFTIPKGHTLGVIGRSGAGKSTLADLLIGLIPPLKGRILVDETVLNEECVGSWMKMIGYIPQSAYILDGTLAENIAFGLKAKEINHQRVLKCCEMAAMNDFINKLPEGLNTQLGDRGVKLSGGQQQRVSIARALYNDPEVIIFDEATSSLDTKSERDIQQTIYSLKGRLTIVIIAHRLSTVEGCDEIIWLENGRIRQTGKPDDILPEYRNWMRQDSTCRADGQKHEPF